MKIVTAAVLIHNGKILIAKRLNSDSLAGKWEFPGGSVEPSESPEECLKREMKEEFNIAINIESYFGVSSFEYSHGVIKLIAFKATWTDGDLIMRSHQDYVWARPRDLNNYDFAPADIPFVNKIISEGVYNDVK